jgi:hypothetical protein
VITGAAIIAMLIGTVPNKAYSLGASNKDPHMTLLSIGLAAVGGYIAANQKLWEPGKVHALAVKIKQKTE